MEAVAGCSALRRPPTQLDLGCLICWTFRFPYIVTTNPQLCCPHFRGSMFFLLAISLLVLPVSSQLQCSGSQLQHLIGEYSAVCSTMFSDTVTLSSEMYAGLHLLNHTATRLHRLLAQVWVYGLDCNFYLSCLFKPRSPVPRDSLLRATHPLLTPAISPPHLTHLPGYTCLTMLLVF